MNNTEKNRRVMTHVMNALVDGDARPFVDAMDVDFTWVMPGSKMAGKWEGKEHVLEGLLRPLVAQFETTYKNRPRRIFTDGAYVIIECKGDVMTKTGHHYANDYCWIIQMADGKMKELTEYMDTALVNEKLEPLS